MRPLPLQAPEARWRRSGRLRRRPRPGAEKVQHGLAALDAAGVARRRDTIARPGQRHRLADLVDELTPRYAQLDVTRGMKAALPGAEHLLIAMMMCLTLRLFHSSTAQKPMPTPPVSISAAAITSQAVPSLSCPQPAPAAGPYTRAP